MKIVVTYSSKEGLLEEYKKRAGNNTPESEISADFFAEGDSPQTIQAIIDTFVREGHYVVGVEADDAMPQKLEDLRPGFVFNLAEGLFGDFRESYVPLVCERLGIPYSGSDPLTLAICLNKARTKEILGYYIPTNPLNSMILIFRGLSNRCRKAAARAFLTIRWSPTRKKPIRESKTAY